MAESSLSDIDVSSDKVFSSAVSNELTDFIKGLYQNKNTRFATFSFAIDAIDPLAYLEMCWNKDSYQYYWEQPADQFAIAAGNELLSISASGKSRFKETQSKIADIRKDTAEFSMISHPYSGMMFLGGFSFFDTMPETPWEAFKPATLSIPKWLIIKEGKFSLATIAVSLEEHNSPGALNNYVIEQFNRLTASIKSSFYRETTNEGNTKAMLPDNGGTEYNRWISSVCKAKEHISQNNFSKIVLARHIAVSNISAVAPTQVINNLRQHYSNCYNFLIHRPNGNTFLGSTPERLGAFRDRMMLTDALAGSIKRGRTATEDSILEKDLSSSRKNRNEHNFVIRAIEERLTPLAESIHRSRNPEIKKLSNVQHLYTPIRLKLKKKIDILEVIGKLHPTPAVGGYPWQKAAPYIRKLEDFDRGWYAGTVGWLNSTGSGEFAVAIRSGLLTQNEAHFFAGCGIVEDSDPAAEWEETNLKLKPMLSALQYD
ncbi:MAG: isochorismate synthase [Balneolaceae bacterium]|jgi:menaquinone-specific isochorismate synthase